MPLKQLYILPLSVVGSSMLVVMGLAQGSRPQNQPMILASSTPTPRATVMSTPRATVKATPSAVPQSSQAQPQPGCLTPQASSQAIAQILTSEQTQLAVNWFLQGKSAEDVYGKLDLTKKQKRQLRAVGKQQCPVQGS